MKKTLTILSLGALLLSSPALMAEQHKTHQPKVMKQMLGALALTKEQRASIKTYKQQMRQQMKEVRQATHNVIPFYPTRFDKAVFIEQARHMFEKKIQIRANFMENLYNTLTASQKEKMIQFMKDKKAK